MWTTMDSPVGELTILGDGTAVTAIEFDGPPVATRRPSEERRADDPVLAEAVRQLSAYFAGDLKEFDLPLDPAGTPFQQRVWERLRGIGYGQTASYGEIARSLGLTGHGARAVGLANGRNPIPIVVPCHRVVGAKGTLTGYAGGLDRKQLLLDLEQGALF
jgi:methylated-DNA-[protein]-cysteine S-methyltransferase